MITFLLSITEESARDKIIYIYNTYHGDMIKLARNRLRIAGVGSYKDDAEDVVQNAFVKISKYINSINFDAGEKKLKAYILSIVVNEVYQALKDREYFEDIELHEQELSDDSFFEKLAIKEEYDRAVEQIKRMDEKYSITLLYHYCEDMSVKEIAELMGLPEQTVYTRLTRGKRILLDMMGGVHGDE